MMKTKYLYSRVMLSNKRGEREGKRERQTDRERERIQGFMVLDLGCRGKGVGRV